MKNLLIYINPRKNFGVEENIAIKIQIDNSLELGWKKEDMLLVTNFPYEYQGIKALQIGNENYCDFCPTASKINAIIALFEKKLIEKKEIYWFHDLDVYQLVNIPESELDMNKTDLLICDFGRKPRWNTGSFFFKWQTKDIFCWTRDIIYKHHTDDERALWVLTGHDDISWGSRVLIKGYTTKNIPQLKNINNRIKNANITYDFHSFNARSNYKNAIKPIRAAHFHIIPRPLNPTNPRPDQIDFFLRGINVINQQIVPERLVTIFHRYGIGLTSPKKTMKNLIIYINPVGKFLKKEEVLAKRQIDNSLKFGWKRKDIVFVTNFPYSYRGVKTMVVDSSRFNNLDEKAYKFNVLAYLADLGIINDGELWWYHDLNVFQIRKIKGSEIDLKTTYVGLSSHPRLGKFTTNNIFFRRGCQKMFGWIRNTVNKLHLNETAALTLLIKANYRDVNSMYKTLNLGDKSPLVKTIKHPK